MPADQFCSHLTHEGWINLIPLPVLLHFYCCFRRHPYLSHSWAYIHIDTCPYAYMEIILYEIFPMALQLLYFIFMLMYSRYTEYCYSVGKRPLLPSAKIERGCQDWLMSDTLQNQGSCKIWKKLPPPFFPTPCPYQTSDILSVPKSK